MKFFRLVFFPAVITILVFSLIAYVSYRGNKDYDSSQINSMDINNNVFPHSDLPYASSNHN